MTLRLGSRWAQVSFDRFLAFGGDSEGVILAFFSHGYRVIRPCQINQGKVNWSLFSSEDAQKVRYYQAEASRSRYF